MVLTFCIDKQMPEKKYFQQTFLLCKCHLTAGIPFGGKPLSPGGWGGLIYETEGDARRLA